MFLACGDALFDMFARAGEEAGAITLDGRIGGSPLNVAVGLARLGERTGYFTKISTDLFGARISAHLASEGVDTRLCLRSNQNSTLAMVELDDAGVPNYAFYVNGTSDRSITAEELPGSLPAAVRAIHIGSYTTATEPTASTLVKLVTREAPIRFISYDPNVRASIEPDLEVWRRRISSLAGVAHLIKASDEDLNLLYPGVSHENLARSWLAQGVQLAVITRGAKGAVGYSQTGGMAEVAGVSVDVIDTVGAGDTFQAALLAGLSRNGRLEPDRAGQLKSHEIAALLGFAASAAAITCSRRGADLPREDEVTFPEF